MLAGKQVNGWFKSDWTGQGCGERAIGAKRGAPSDRGGAAVAAAPAYRGCWFAHSDGSGRLVAAERRGPIRLSDLASFAGLNPTMLRSEEHTSELQSLRHLVCRLLLEKKK